MSMKVYSLEDMKKFVLSDVELGLPITCGDLEKRYTGFTKSRQKHFKTHDEFIEFCGLNPKKYWHKNRKKMKVSSDCGLLFEEILKDLFVHAGLKFEYQKTVGDLRPDFILQDNIWIECKINKRIATKHKLKKYQNVHIQLIILYLTGENEYVEKVEGVKYVSVFEFMDNLISKKLLSEDKYCELLRRFSLVKSIYQTICD